MIMNMQTVLSFLLLLSMLTACRSDDLPTEEGTPLSFSTLLTKTGLSSLFEDFRVWGCCMANGERTAIMPGYRVNSNDAVGWTYSVGEGTEGQALQYWNHAADGYRFHAGTPVARVENIGESTLTLAMKATTTLSETCLFSQPCVVERTDPTFGSVVNLLFTYANARINVAFRYLSDTPVSIGDIRLIPPSPYATAATLQMEYDWTRRIVSPGALTSAVRSSDALTFPAVEVPANEDEAVPTSVPWYMIPDPLATGKWRLSITVGSDIKEVEFTIAEPWQPGRSYVYRFEYTTEANLVFVGTDTELFVGEHLESGGEHDFN